MVARELSCNADAAKEHDSAVLSGNRKFSHTLTFVICCSAALPAEPAWLNQCCRNLPVGNMLYGWRGGVGRSPWGQEGGKVAELLACGLTCKACLAWAMLLQSSNTGPAVWEKGGEQGAQGGGGGPG